MTTGRVIWIIWCLLWAGFWAVTGLLSVVGIVVFGPIAVLSVLAILLPIGKAPAPPRATCPFCGASGEPTLMPLHLQAAHGQTLPGYPAMQVAPQPYIQPQPRPLPPG